MTDIFSTSMKTEKSPPGWRSIVCFMPPHKTDQDDLNLCPMAGQCVELCYSRTGRLAMPNSLKAQEWRRRLFVEERRKWEYLACHEIEKHARRASKANERLAVRVDGTTDTGWGSKLCKLFDPKLVTFYDYTKVLDRARRYLDDNEYHVAYSFSEKADPQATEDFLEQRGIVATVFDNRIPASWGPIEGGKEYPVTDGDVHDLFFLRGKVAVLGLETKGRARKTRGGLGEQREFVQRVP